MTYLQGFWCFWAVVVVVGLLCVWGAQMIELTKAHSDIRASAISDTLPEYECEHYGVDSGGTDYYGTSNPPQESDWNYPFCPKCGERL